MESENINIITNDNLHISIINYIQDKGIVIGEYQHMKDCVLEMIKEKYFFNMDRDRLRDAMEDITFSICPNDDVNKDRVSRGLEYEYSDEEYSDEEIDEAAGLEFIKQMANLNNQQKNEGKSAESSE